jgi:FAD dependent oxidoreductase
MTNDLHYDVAVVGGGVTGVAAGIAAARTGARTVVLEPRPFVGGNATTGLCLHSFLTRDMRQTVFGIAQEMVDRLIAVGAAVGHIPYGGFVSAVTPVDGDWFRIVAAEMLAEAGAQVIYGASVVAVEKQGSAITGLVTAMKGGLRTVRAGSYVDTSGDADIAAFAGCPTRKGEAGTGKMQPVSMLMHFHNVDTNVIAATLGEVAPAIATRPDHPEPFPVYFNGTFSRWNDVIEREGIFPNRDHKVFFNTVWPTRVNVNTSAIFGVDGTDPLAMSRAMQELTRQCVRAGNFLKKHVPGFENSYFVPQVVAGVRESRNIIGHYELTKEDVLGGRKFDDTVGQICFPVDIHHPDTGQAYFVDIGDDGAFDVPYRSLLPQGVDNLIVAGRCLSATHFAHGATRNMAPCLVTGQAAGTAAAMAAQRNAALAQLEVDVLQEKLVRDGAYLGRAFEREQVSA